LSVPLLISCSFGDSLAKVRVKVLGYFSAINLAPVREPPIVSDNQGTVVFLNSFKGISLSASCIK